MPIEVSVIIPTYNRTEFVIEAVNSAKRAFNYARIDEISEIIVIDDGWSENTELALQKLNMQNLIYSKNPTGPGAGPAAARNYGVELSKGNYIAWLDDDDLFLENRFVTSIKILQAGIYNVIFENAWRENDDNNDAMIFGPSRCKEYTDPFYYLLEGSAIWSCATMFTKQIFLSVNGMDESMKGDGEDGEFLLKLSIKGKVMLERGAPVGYVRRHAGNISGERKYYVPLKGLKTLMRNIDFKNHPEKMNYLKKFIQSKLNFSLTKCRLEYTYFSRLREGVKVLWYYNWSYLTWANVKSIIVWLGLTGK